MSVVRAGLLVAALAAIAWAAVGLREARLAESGSAVATGPASGLSAARTAQAAQDLRDAARLTGHRDPDAFRARILVRTGHPRRAVAILRGLVADEPDNASYWLALAAASRDVDPALSARARARVVSLDPVAGAG
jgi:tetratricopeptide repeat protein